MDKRFLLVNGAQEDPWHGVIEEALSKLGSLRVCKTNDVTELLREQIFDVVIIDATTVKDIPLFVARLRLLSRDAKIVVTTALPTWEQAREIFYVGAADYIPKSLNKQELFSDTLTDFMK